MRTRPTLSGLSPTVAARTRVARSGSSKVAAVACPTKEARRRGRSAGNGRMLFGVT
jgi:hypothetical protein